MQTHDTVLLQMYKRGQGRLQQVQAPIGSTFAGPYSVMCAKIVDEGI